MFPRNPGNSGDGEFRTFRRRGPRSAEARERRRRNRERQLEKASGNHFFSSAPVRACGQTLAPPKEELTGVSTRALTTSRSFSIWFINARSIIGFERRGVVRHYLEVHRPAIFGIVETWLDEQSVKHLAFDGYTQVHRRDRPGARPGRVNHGGIILYRRNEAAPLVTFLEESAVAERFWVRIESDLGPVLMGLWYRPPGAPEDVITSLESELSRLSNGMIGVVLMGDFNIWQRSWLKYSPCDTPSGNKIKDIAHKYGRKQLVKERTHIHGNLLDLVLSSLSFPTVCELTPRIADHNGILTNVKVPVH